MPAALTLLYDGGCPLCMREVNFLRRRDRKQQLAFVDINADDYKSLEHGGVTYREAMGRIHAPVGLNIEAITAPRRFPP